MSSADRETVTNAVTQLGLIPRAVDPSRVEATKVYVFAFDGTENDRDNFDKNIERETTVGYLATELEIQGLDVEYIVGPGVDSKYDAMACESCFTKAENSLTLLKEKLSRDLSIDTNIDVKVIVLGFSRGAAIGRHFMNLISETWPDDHQFKIRSYGLLFDTVATSVTNELMLGIAPTTDYLVHIVARDERRILFPAIVDNDLAYKVEKQGNLVTTPRLTQLELPGVHSDIGGSYKSGVGSFYRFLGELVLVDYGLIPQTKTEFSDDFFSQGVHDSRGWFSKLRGVKPYLEQPSLVRENIIKDSVPISKLRAESITVNNISESSSFFQYVETATLLFKVYKIDDDLKILSAHTSDIISFKDLEFEVVDGERYISFRYDGWPDKQMLSIEQKVWAEIPENEVSTVELVSLKREEEEYSYILVNDVLVKKY